MRRSTKIFTESLLEWFKEHGRKHLPWQNPRSAYRVWLSEIMLQQTQVKTVIPYFIRFIARFPDLKSLAMASVDDVLALWSGLGYYSRARNLHKTAQLIYTHFQSKFPNDLPALIALPGIGPSTAAAIASLAFEQPTAILDGNVARVLSRYFLVYGVPTLASVKKELWQLANDCMPKTQCADYTQAIMDMGATCCTLKSPQCSACPLQKTCQAYLRNEVADYPQKKPQKIRPIQAQQFLLLHTVDLAFYLEKRAPSGIWGGLWCLPSIDAHDCPKQYVKNTYQQVAGKTEQFMTLKHSFTHFHLHISAISMLVQSKVSMPSGQWFTWSDLDHIGLAKPVRTIVENFVKVRSV